MKNLLWPVLFAWALWGNNALAGTPVSPTPNVSAAPQLGDEIILASTRRYPSAVGRTLDWNTFHGFRCQPWGGVGEPVSLLDESDVRPVWVFVHGNQIPADEAIRRGVSVYQRLRGGQDSATPIRFVIWSWPSQRETCRIADAKLKAKRTEAEAFYLASYLTRISAEVPVSLIAYSFGARIVSGGLHLASGGQLSGYRLPHRLPAIAPFRVAFMAAAVESSGFRPGGRYARALSQVDELLLLNNSKDKALQFFWVVNCRERQALGAVGMPCNPSHTSIQQYDWAKYIGSDHTIWRYLERPIVLQRINDVVRQSVEVYQPAPAASEPSQQTEPADAESSDLDMAQLTQLP